MTDEAARNSHDRTSSEGPGPLTGGRVAVTDHIESAVAELVAAASGERRHEVRAWRESAVRGVHSAVAAARQGLLPLDAETTGRLLFALTDVAVRDAACGVATTGPEDPVETLWLDLALRAPAAWGAAPAAVLSYVRWSRGDHGGAERAAATAMNLDPEESLAPLVHAAAAQRLDPSRAVGAHPRRDRGENPRGDGGRLDPAVPVRPRRRTARRRRPRVP